MNRRGFLKVSTTAVLALLASRLSSKSLLSTSGSQTPTIAELGGKLYKGTDDGRILVSADGGLFWHCVADWGAELQIEGLSNTGNKLVARIGTANGEFELFSTNGVAWRTIA